MKLKSLQNIAIIRTHEISTLYQLQIDEILDNIGVSTHNADGPGISKRDFKPQPQIKYIDHYDFSRN